jgi:predicted dehydrogenase
MIRVGVIGTGSKGCDHIRDSVKHPQAEVVAAADSDEGRLRQVADEFGIKHAYTDYRELLEQEDVQAVTVATPSFLHREMVVAAAEKGKHVHCEKPFALTLAEADDMIRACEVRDLVLFVSFSPRLRQSFQEIREMLSSGDYGKPMWLWSRSFLPVDPEIWMPPPWFWRKELGGGLLIENGGHTFDVAEWIMGDVVKVIAEVDTLRHTESRPPYFTDPNIEDVGTIILRHEEGAISTIGLGAIAPGWPPTMLEIVTESSYFRLIGSRLVVEKNAKIVSETDYGNRSAQGKRPIDYFIESIREGVRPPATGEEGRRALEIGLAALRSAQCGVAVSLPLVP